MNLDLRKPDLPLRLAFYSLRFVLRSPIGASLIGIGQKYLAPPDHAWFEISQNQIRLPHLASEFSGYRLAQISDFHLGTWADRERLEYAIRRVNELNPDLVAITGDFVTHNPAIHAADLVHILRMIRAADGVYAVLGNHDHWSDPVEIRKILRQAGVVELRNQHRTIQRGPASLHIAGVDDMMENLDDLPAVLDRLPTDGAAILLAHEPDFGDQSAASGRFDLQLSGHTHGGQVHFPRLGPLILPRLGRKYPCGMYKVNDMLLYTNRGLGTAEIELRFRCPAEISLFELFPTGGESKAGDAILIGSDSS